MSLFSLQLTMSRSHWLSYVTPSLPHTGLTLIAHFLMHTQEAKPSLPTWHSLPLAQSPLSARQGSTQFVGLVVHVSESKVEQRSLQVFPCHEHCDLVQEAQSFMEAQGRGQSRVLDRQGGLVHCAVHIPRLH